MVIAAIAAWVIFRLLNWPLFAEFLISVEAEMNRESWASKLEVARARGSVRQEPVEEHRPRITEVRADRVLLVEGLDRPRVGLSAGARDERDAAEKERDEAKPHGS